MRSACQGLTRKSGSTSGRITLVPHRTLPKPTGNDGRSFSQSYRIKEFAFSQLIFPLDRWATRRNDFFKPRLPNRNWITGGTPAQCWPDPWGARQRDPR